MTQVLIKTFRFEIFNKILQSFVVIFCMYFVEHRHNAILAEARRHKRTP